MSLVNIKRALRKNILVNKLIKRYYSSMHKRNVIRLQKHGYSINSEIAEALKGKLEYCAWAGTLLGVVRDNGFIKGDDDLDYCVNAENIDEWNILYERMTTAGYALKHFFVYNGVITEMAFSKHGLGIDFFGFQPVGKRTSVIIYYRDSKEKYKTNEASCIRICLNPYSSLIERDINGSKFLIPDNYEEFLVSNYGDNWRIPQNVSYTEILGERVFMPEEHGKIRHRWNLKDIHKLG